MAITTEQLREALVQATHRIIVLERDREFLLDGLHDALDRIVKLEDQIDVALGKPSKQMSEEQIARSMDATAWSPGKPTPVSPVEQLKLKLGTMGNL
ncbi:hypothetical protein [Methylobacterium fujisawaense]|uniref:hypothetical protein n=1 Tax=Methylobacterium fujisawaense TaxID=107400 RepID=UPI00313E2BEB